MRLTLALLMVGTCTTLDPSRPTLVLLTPTLNFTGSNYPCTNSTYTALELLAQLTGVTIFLLVLNCFLS